MHFSSRGFETVGHVEAGKHLPDVYRAMPPGARHATPGLGSLDHPDWIDLVRVGGIGVGAFLLWKHFSKKGSRVSGLGALGEPITVSLGAAAIFAGGTILLKALRGTPDAPAGPPPKIPPNKCDSKVLQQTVAASASGAAAGSAAGPYGAGAGAVIGAGLAPDTLRCGVAAINAAKAQVCAKADSVVKELKKRGVAVPANYSKLSCDQKIALVAALASPLGVTALALLTAGGVALQGAKITVSVVNDAFKRTTDSITSTLTSSHTSAGSDGVTVAGHKIV